MSADDERALIEVARRGDRSAQDRLIQRCAPSLENYLGRQMGAGLRRYASVSDLGQEVLLRAIHVMDRLPEDASFADFERLLRRQARWLATDHARAARNFAGESAAEVPLDEARDPRSVESRGSVTNSDEAVWFAGLVDRLDPDLAEVVRLRLDGLSFAEIASRTGIELNAARKRYLRAAGRLRRLGESHK